MYHSEEEESYITNPKGKPTTGEWRHERGVGQYFKVVGDKKLAHVWSLGDDYPNSMEAEANARLMSAAPDLLEALEEIVKVSYEDVMTPEHRDKAEQAIKKAKGE